jgi:hypothetical protein
MSNANSSAGLEGAQRAARALFAADRPDRTRKESWRRRLRAGINQSQARRGVKRVKTGERVFGTPENIIETRGRDRQQVATATPKRASVSSFVCAAGGRQERASQSRHRFGPPSAIKLTHKAHERAAREWPIAAAALPTVAQSPAGRPAPDSTCAKPPIDRARAGQGRSERLGIELESKFDSSRARAQVGRRPATAYKRLESGRPAGSRPSVRILRRVVSRPAGRRDCSEPDRRARLCA